MSEFWQRIQGFSPNAKLFLSASILSGLSYGIWMVIFNLYLLELGFSAGFISVMAAVEWWFHGGFAFFAGLIGDRIGPRQAFLAANCIRLVFMAGLLLTGDPRVLAVLAALAGIAASFHGVVGGPFIMANSSPRDRVYLFSLNATLSTVSAFVGHYLGGALPTALGWLGGAPVLTAYRLTLALGIPLALISLLPLTLIREQTDLRGQMSLKNLVSGRAIIFLTLISVVTGLSFGFTGFGGYFNIFFAHRFGFTEGGIGGVYAVASLSAAAGTLLIPGLVGRLGKVRALAATRLGAVIGLLLVVLAPVAAMAVGGHILREALTMMAYPIMTWITMELVTPAERFTVAGLTHTAFEFPMGFTARMAGPYMDAGQFAVPFTWSALLLIAAAGLLMACFGRLDRSAAGGVSA